MNEAVLPGTVSKGVQKVLGDWQKDLNFLEKAGSTSAPHGEDERSQADDDDFWEAVVSSSKGEEDMIRYRDDLYHWTIAHTRSFAWKPAGSKEGKMVMCPFLDYMNHCASGDGVRNHILINV